MREVGFTDTQKRSKPGTGGNDSRPIDLFLSFLRLGAMAFGGPAMVAYIGELAVKQKKWLDQATFQRGVALCQIIPGATAMQVAAYVGMQARGIPGALCGFTGFGLPAFALMIVLSYLYAVAHDLAWTQALFKGFQVMVVALAANAAYTFGKGALKGRADLALALASAILLWFGINPFYVIFGAAVAGLIVKREYKMTGSGGGKGVPLSSSRILVLFLSLAGGLVVLFLVRRDLFHLSLLMMKIDLFAFGGGFASVPLMLQEIVNVHGWMDSRVFMDGIALGQITPGPIVITSTFVGYLLYGLPGAVVATIAIFTPSFILVVIGTAFFDRLDRSAYFERAVGGILASFVGLLFYMTVKFSLAIPWDSIRIFLACAIFLALVKKVNTLYIVSAMSLLGILLFR